MPSSEEKTLDCDHGVKCRKTGESREETCLGSTSEPECYQRKRVRHRAREYRAKQSIKSETEREPCYGLSVRRLDRGNERPAVRREDKVADFSKNVACFRCAQPEHFAKDCKVKFFQGEQRGRTATSKGSGQPRSMPWQRRATKYPIHLETASLSRKLNQMRNWTQIFGRQWGVSQCCKTGVGWGNETTELYGEGSDASELEAKGRS
jgi:hypothetical protein